MRGFLDSKLRDVNGVALQQRLVEFDFEQICWQVPDWHMVALFSVGRADFGDEPLIVPSSQQVNACCEKR